MRLPQKWLHNYWCSCGIFCMVITDTAHNIEHKACCILMEFRLLLSNNWEEQTTPYWQLVHTLGKRIVQEMSWRCRQFSCRLCSKQFAASLHHSLLVVHSTADLPLSNQMVIQLLLKCSQQCNWKEKKSHYRIFWWHLINILKPLYIYIWDQ